MSKDEMGKIPQEILDSPEFQRSTPQFALAWVEKHRCPEVCKALENAATVRPVEKEPK